jgi:hypothetical protein
MTVLQLGCLATNVSARRFYKAIDRRIIDEHRFDEDGVLLPEEEGG